MWTSLNLDVLFVTSDMLVFTHVRLHKAGFCLSSFLLFLARSHNFEKRLSVSSCLSARNGTARLTLDILSLNIIFEFFFRKSVEKNSSAFKI
jgi:hypothetical protein